MCKKLDAPASESDWGELVELCPKFPEHLPLKVIGYEWDTVEARSLHGLLQAFAPARYLVIEFDYFDIDFRSEYREQLLTRFQITEPSTQRLHFFGGGPRKLPPTLSMREFVIRAEKAYKGYSVFRPHVPGLVGRSMVSPTGRLEVLRKPTTRDHHIRTSVAEEVHLFGVSLTVVGVPFMEQDGHLQACAQVSSWMCHYTAVLRGIVARRVTASFSSPRAGEELYGRRYPTDGMTAAAVCSMLSRLDLPPETLSSMQLSKSRDPLWCDRQEVWQAADLPFRTSVRAQFWFRENLTSTVCRYINSGMPVILAREDREHTQVVCGYLRDEDLRKPAVRDSQLRKLHSDVASFIVSDDQRGPYEEVAADELVAVLMRSATATMLIDDEGPAPMVPSVEGSDEEGWQDLSVIVPLPAGLWLSGATAEQDGARIFEECVRARLDQTLRWARSRGMSPADARKYVSELKRTVAGIEQASAAGDGAFAVRSYAAASNDFKSGFAERFKHPEASAVVGLTQMPKYVWVVEILDRALRSANKDAVVGTVVLDASTVTHSPRDVTDLYPLIVHIPGQISRMDYEQWADGEGWFATPIEPYLTGRWNHQNPWLLDARRSSARSKTAVPSS